MTHHTHHGALFVDARRRIGTRAFTACSGRRRSRAELSRFALATGAGADEVIVVGQVLAARAARRLQVDVRDAQLVACSGGNDETK